MRRRGPVIATPNAQPTRITGSFTVAELAGDYSAERYAFARHLGASVGAISAPDWRRVQPLLEALWLQRDGELSFEEARPAIFQAWQSAQRLSRGDDGR